MLIRKKAWWPGSFSFLWRSSHLPWKQRNWKVFLPISPSFPISHLSLHLSVSISLFIQSLPFPLLPHLSFYFSLTHLWLMCLSRSWWFCVSRGKSAPQQTVSWPGPPMSLWDNSCKSECGRSGPLCCTSEGSSPSAGAGLSQALHTAPWTLHPLPVCRAEWCGGPQQTEGKS